MQDMISYIRCVLDFTFKGAPSLSLSVLNQLWVDTDKLLLSPLISCLLSSLPSTVLTADQTWCVAMAETVIYTRVII